MASSLTSWLGDREDRNSSRLGDHLVHGTVHDVGGDRGSDTNEVGWHSDVNLELDLEGRVIGGGQVLNDWDNQIVGGGGSSNGALWSFVLEGDSSDGVGFVDTPLGAGTGGTPSPVTVGNWVLDPSGTGRGLNSVVSDLVAHLEDEVPRLLDSNSVGPVGHGDDELHGGSLSWELFSGGISGGDLVGSKSDGSWSGRDGHRVEDSVDVHDGSSSTELVHSGLHGDWSPRTNFDASTNHGQTVGGVFGQGTGESTSELVAGEVTRTGVGGCWDREGGSEWPDVDSGSSWYVTRG